jgi:gamma-glutamyltranspeptidase/glutathione hydrolase
MRAIALCVLCLAGCAASVAPPEPRLPLQSELASGWTPKPGWTSQNFMVATAHPLATDAGYRILRAGGSAVDAAIAVQMVLTLVEPDASGIGGGAFLVHWDGAAVQAWDGRETAPAGVDAKLFLGPDGQPMAFAQAKLGGRAVATPGVLKMLQAAHRQHGRLPWARLFEPAIALAEGGFPLGARLHRLLQEGDALKRDARARAYFFDAEGQAHPVGHGLRNPALAAVMRSLAAQGSDAFYRGPMAAELVQRVQADAVPGALSQADLAAYVPRQRDAMCTLWLRVYRVCGMPPPSSGHLAVMQILGMLERVPGALGPTRDADSLHAYTEASRLAFADRAQYVADPDFVAAPGANWGSLLDGGYLDERAALIGTYAMKAAPAGQPPGGQRSAWAPMPPQPEHGTSHISVVDAQGQAVAMTTSIEAVFGAHVMADGGTGLAGGYLLNNQMTDFSFAPTDAQGRLVANRVQPGKRPRSSMSPTLVFDARDGRLLMTLGSPGGPFIIHYVAKTLLGTLAWSLDPQRAIDLSNVGLVNGPLLLEPGAFSATTIDGLRQRGHRVVEAELPSGLQAIQRTASGWRGGADPRREGTALGD